MTGQGSLFNSDGSGVNVTYMWFGQVVDESTWVENHAREDSVHSLRSRDDFQGYGFRYKVRIFGRELEDKTSDRTTKDEELYMADVVLPVTAGSGHAGSQQTPNIRQGNYVFGFYNDGVEATEPIIFGILPNHAQTRLFGNDPEKGFVPRTGYNGRYGPVTVANKNVLGQGPDAGNPASEGIEANYVQDVRDIDILLEQRTHYLPKTYDCDTKSSGALSAIQKVIQQVIGILTKVKSAANSFSGAASDVLGGINSLIEDAALVISDIAKGIIDKMRGFAENILNDLLDIGKSSLLPPFLSSADNDGIGETVTTILACVFNKIINGLFKAVFKLLKNALKRSLSYPLCAVEDFMGGLLAGILGPISSTLSSISSLVTGIVDAASSITSGILKALSTALGFIDFLTCDVNNDCSAGDGWSFWYGDQSSTIQVPNLSDAISKNISNIGSGNGGGGGFCDTAPKLAKTPDVKFVGGGGKGAFGNLIVSPSGRILGVDMIDGGTGYTSPPSVILDDSGPGSGAVLFPRLVSDNSFYGGSGGDTSRNPPDSLIDLNSDPDTKDVNLKINSSDGTPEIQLGPSTPGVGEKFPDLFIGGNGGVPVTFDGPNDLKYKGRVVKLCSQGTPLKLGGQNPVNTNKGPLIFGGNGGTPVRVGGNGGETLQIESEPLCVEVDVPLFDEVDDSELLAGPINGTFKGKGTFSDGSFSGKGLFETPDFTVEGFFSGFDNLLSGSGTGSFEGSGVLTNSRFEGDGKFTADNPNKSQVFDGLQFPDNNTINFEDGTVVKILPDGTGTIEFPNGKKKAVTFAKVGATSGSPVKVNDTPVTYNGQSVSIGGNGGSVLNASLECDDTLLAGDISGLVSGLNICTQSGIPIAVGDSLNENPDVLFNGIPAKSGSNNLKSVYNIGSKNQVSVDGSFSGPDGSPIQEVVIVDPGTGYLPKPDGSIYVNGAEVSKPDGTIIFNPNTGYNFYPPNVDVPVVEGDIAYLPPGTEVQVINNFGDPLQSIIGLGQETGIPIEQNGILTTPTYEKEDDILTEASSSDGRYPAVLKINDILIANPGMNYSPEDEIVIEPANGAILEPEYDNFGRLVTVNIIDPGLGFNDVPNIFVRTNTGLNAVIIPIFGVERIGDLTEIEDQINALNANVIEVIDCVGKVGNRRQR